MEQCAYQSRTVEAWSSGFVEVYKTPDAKRRPEEFWNAVMAHLSVIGETIRRMNYRELFKSAAHTFCWMTCYVAKCQNTDDLIFKINNSFGEIVGLKFPNKCGHCVKSPCFCDPVEMDSVSDKSSKYNQLFNEWKLIRPSFNTFSIDNWLQLFRNIYAKQIHLLAFENIGFHLLEEAGEEAKAVRELIQFRGVLNEKIDGLDKDFLESIASIENLVPTYYSIIDELKKKYSVDSDKRAWKNVKSTEADPLSIKARIIKSKMDFFIELADTFSWFCAVLIKIENIIKDLELTPKEGEFFSLEKALMELYQSDSPDAPLSCYACGKKSCECIFYHE